VFLQGFLAKNGFCCGVFVVKNVVDCVVNVVRERTVFQVGKMGQGFELFFRRTARDEVCSYSPVRFAWVAMA
jgi:hypothetical protein